MSLRLARRLLTEPSPRILWKFVHGLGLNGMVAVNRFKQRVKRGEYFPAFLFISLTNRCNLKCRGCWVTQTKPPVDLDRDVLEKLIESSKQHGSRFFGLLGGEPLLYPELFDVLERHRDCYFLVFTNGTLLTDAVARRLRELGNVTPLISIEGLEEASDERRGGKGVYAGALQALGRCREQRLVTGVATSVCQTNFDDLVSEKFLNDLAARGVHYAWYYIYRPAGAEPAPELALSEEQIVALRRFIVDVRARAPVVVVDAYWDQDGNALCPAAVGISHHINPWGDVEVCPPIQFAADSVTNGEDPGSLLKDSAFLRTFRNKASACTRGCLLLEDPELLRSIVEESGARDTSGRSNGLAELGRMRCRAGHHLPGKEIPEKDPFTRFAKKHWFFGFGAYG